MDPKNSDGYDFELNLTDEEIKDYYFYVCLTKKDDSVEITKKKWIYFHKIINYLLNLKKTVFKKWIRLGHNYTVNHKKG